MRSLMFVPAHNEKLLESAVRRDADVLLLDIEDSVPYPDKQRSSVHWTVYSLGNEDGSGVLNVQFKDQRYRFGNVDQARIDAARCG